MVPLVRLLRMSGAVVTRDTDADQQERREHDHHTTEDQQTVVVVHVGSLGPGPARSMTPCGGNASRSEVQRSAHCVVRPL